nr:hypothetical protein [uncultured bacterium]
MKLASIIFLLLLPFLCHAEDMMKYVQDTNALVENGEYKKALGRTIWFHNHALEYDIGMYGVRLSFALNDWVDLGEKYPPALKTLKNIRDTKTERLTSGSGNPNLFIDVFAINQALSENEKTIKLFKKLEITQPKLASRVWPMIKDMAAKENEAALLKKYGN